MLNDFFQIVTNEMQQKTKYNILSYKNKLIGIFKLIIIHNNKFSRNNFRSNNSRCFFASSQLRN